MESDSYFRNIVDLSTDGEANFEGRVDSFFEEPFVPFGAAILYHPISSKDKTDYIKLVLRLICGGELDWRSAHFRCDRSEEQPRVGTLREKHQIKRS